MLHATRAQVQIRQMRVPLVVRLPDLAATEALAKCLASVAHPGDCICLEGSLGAGKTAFARAFLRAATADPQLDVPSPSFTLVQIYDTGIGPVFHYDLWRLEGSASMAELDWEDALDGIVLVEWPDRLGELRPPEALTIELRLGNGEEREATLLGWEGRFPAGTFPARHGEPEPPVRGGARPDRETSGRRDKAKTSPRNDMTTGHHKGRTTRRGQTPKPHHDETPIPTLREPVTPNTTTTTTGDGPAAPGTGETSV
jgi:tRNA threonylcarbamoyladenosine biosynthesis protein TsaE